MYYNVIIVLFSVPYEIIIILCYIGKPVTHVIILSKLFHTKIYNPK